MLSEFFNTEIWNALGYSILHFLWQGIAIGLFAFLILQWNVKSNATTRHSIACAALLVSIAVFIGTFIISLNTFDYAIAPITSIETISLTS